MSSLEYELNFQANGVDQVKGVATALQAIGNAPEFAWLGQIGQQIQKINDLVQKLKAGFDGLGVAGGAIGAGIGAFVMITRAIAAQREEIERLHASLMATRDAYDNLAAANARRFKAADTKEENDNLAGDLQEQIRQKRQDMASNPGKTKEERDNDRQVIFNLERQLAAVQARNLPTRDQRRAEEERKADTDPLRTSPMRDQQERDINEVQRKRGFDLQYATAGDGRTPAGAATNRLFLLNEEEDRLGRRSRLLEDNAAGSNSASELAKIQAEQLAVEKERSGIMMQILREEENLRQAKKDATKTVQEQAREKMKNTIDELDKEINKTKDSRDQLAGVGTGLDVSNITRIGGSVGGEAAAAANYQRRMLDQLGRMVGLLDKLLAAQETRRGELEATWGGS